MPNPAILGPLLAQVLLTFLLLFWMAVQRGRALSGGKIKDTDIALREPNWPAKAQQAANAFSNQFELPILFYVLTLLHLALSTADRTFVILAWLFVATRYVHALEHVTTNVVRRRGPIFGIGMLLLLAMWVLFAVRVLSGAP